MPLQCSSCKVTYQASYSHCPRCGNRLIKAASPKIIRYILFGVLLFCAVVIFLFWGPTHAHIRALLAGVGQEIYEVRTKPPTVKARQTEQPTFSLENLRTLRKYFEEKQFELLIATANDLQAAFEQDLAYEYQIYDFYRLFETGQPEYEGLLDDWIAYAPNHFAPYLARAHFYYRKAWTARGSKYATETGPEKIDVMHQFFHKAAQDIDAAIAINPRLLTGYMLRIGIHMGKGEDRQKDAAFQEAQIMFPSSSFLYFMMIKSKQPRWGGSYAEMELLASQALASVEKNPELYMLFGQIYLDQANLYRDEKRYNEAITLYSKAGSFGEHYTFFEERARTYRDMKDYDHAIEDVNHAISLRPAAATPYCLRAYIAVLKDDLDGALKDINFVNQQFAGDEDVKVMTDWVAQRLLYKGHAVYKNNLEQAIAYYDKGIEINPRFAEAFYWRGSAYNKLMKSDLAYSDLKKSIQYNPRHFDSYRFLDAILASSKNWDEIIDNWNSYLILEPNSADAYFERAGTYRNKGDVKRALEDLGQACRLGKQEACALLNREDKKGS